MSEPLIMSGKKIIIYLTEDGQFLNLHDPFAIWQTGMPLREYAKKMKEFLRGVANKFEEIELR